MPKFDEFVPKETFQPVLALSPDGSTVAYSGNASGAYDLWAVPVAGGHARRLTRLAGQAVWEIGWTPDGTGLVFTADREGDEQYRIYLITLNEECIVELSGEIECQRTLADPPFSPDGRLLVYAANDRDRTTQDVLVRSMGDSSERRIIPPEGVVFEPGAVSPDGRWLTLGGYQSNTDVAVYLVDLQQPDSEPVCVTAPYGQGFFETGPWAPDSSGFYLRTDLWGEFTAAGFYSLDERRITPVIQDRWDVEFIRVAQDVIMWSVNQNGRSVLHTEAQGTTLDLPSLPQGVISSVALAASADLAVLQLDAASRPTEIAVLDLRAQKLRYLTDARPDALRVSEPVNPEDVLYPASDGRQVHALLYRPPTTGPHPVVLAIHGGPESQERPEYAYAGLYQYLVANNVAVFAPNIAGSTGYGLSYQRLIYRDWGGIDLDDLDHGVRYLRSLADLDGERIAVMGGSYGGFAAISCLARLPYPWTAGVSLCGPTNLVTLARACPPTWETFVANVLGSPDTDREHLTERSPITHAEGIRAPLFVIQGAHDPRVPQHEADQLVQRLRDLGTEVRYDVYPDEGHGFSSRHNQIKAFGDMAEFLLAHLHR